MNATVAEVFAILEALSYCFAQRFCPTIVDVAIESPSVGMKIS